ncbi:acetyl-CoA synthetase-like protein [Aspergillus steynii IBT 23096]|uniref:Acetyl-CoA synthetase-like protein n=1 Tax=Aspergillus steynii IBT 23096 TaxID=1392250 RepID=A0A2I2G6I6_9EURO|nr:acetyl-CoA synthetase-like protein [Aspergillus steynii IBT 23096]PLB48494.1 acetyl-CoA synthetase-like protein [Aspergillus steynii IBT 23096]
MEQPLTSQSTCAQVVEKSVEHPLAAEDFWKEYLKGVDAPHFPQCPDSSQTVSSSETLKRPCHITNQLNTREAFHSAILLAWALTLSQYTDSEEVVFGLVASGQDVLARDIENKKLPITPFRTHSRPHELAQDALSRIRLQQAQILPYQEAGLETIRGLSTDTAKACQFQNVLSIVSQQGPDAGGGCDSCLRPVGNYPLTVLCEMDGPCCLVMVKALFDPQIIMTAHTRWVLEQFTHNLRGILLHQEKTLGAVSEACPEHLGILSSWNSQVPDRIEQGVHELILQNCAARPNATAVSAWDGELTYKELDDLSSSLATRLQQLSVGPSSYVPVYSERSRYVLVAILAIMRAGGAFLLLPDSQPLSRVKELCRRVQAQVVLASYSCEQRLSQSGLPVITLDGDIGQGFENGSPVSVSVSPDDPVYIVFTSGSTGTPKGVVMGHSALATNAVRLAKELGCNFKSRWLACASFAFDVSVMELMFPLVQGACACVPGESQLSNDLEQAIQDFQTDIISSTPLRMRSVSPEKVPMIRTLMVGGEGLLQDDIKQWAPHLNFVQAYGPAECCVVSSKTTVKYNSEPSNLGSGINCNLWVIDHQDPGKRVPIGCPGELLIEGPLVGQGYLNDLEKSAASFVQPPAWLQQMRGEKAKCCYRTGDIVAYSPIGDGSVKFIGRKDNQIKLRGQRMELGEVEAHLRTALPDASSVVVDIINPENADDQKALTAFILQKAVVTDSDNDLFAPVGDPNFASTANIASQYLQARLPAYMVPTVFLPVRRMPSTTSDKLDRRLLRQRASNLPRRTLQEYRTQASSIQRPTNKSEEIVQEMVATVLKLEAANISMDDDFFYLGADSMHVMRLVKSARERDITLMSADVFHFPRLKDIAERMQSRLEGPDKIEDVAPFSLISSATREEIVQTSIGANDGGTSEIEDIYPCTPFQESLLALSATRKGAVAERFSVGLLSDVSLPRFRQAWDSVVQANPILRTTFATDSENKTFQLVHSKGPRWTEDGYVKLPEMGPGQSMIAFGLETDPDSSTSGSVRFVLAMHHALYDGWSYSSLLDQIEDAYCGHSTRTAPFNRFVQHVTSLDPDVANGYWKSQMAGYDSMPYPPRSSTTSGQCPSSYVEDRIAIRSIQGITKASFINVGWAMVLSQLTDCDDIVFGCTATGRDVPVEDIEVLNGPVVAVVPLRIQLRQDDIAIDALKRAQLQTADMAQFQHWGTQNIRKVSRETDAACQFQNLVVTHTPADDRAQSQVFTTVGDTDKDNAEFYTQPLVLVCFQFSDHIDARLRFDPGTITPGQAEAILNQFTHVLLSLQANPHKRLADLPSITQRDMEKLSAWSSPGPIQTKQCVHHLIEEISQKSPERPAVCSWDGSFTYRDLDEQASRLARHLAEQNVGPETFVPICLERSRWVAVAVLGVMKAGGAFVLLEPSQPMQRLHSICTQLDAKVAISSRQGVPSCSALPASIVSISNDETEWQCQTAVEKKPVVQAVPSNALYAVFTSGSTGKPKGVVVQHSAYSSLLQPLLSQTGISKETRYLHFSSFAFDAAITDLLSPLAAGGCLCLPSTNERSNDLAGAARRMGTCTVALTPSILRELDPDDYPTLKLVFIGGEAASASDIAKWSQKKRIVNVYGPAECSDISTLQPDMTPQTGGNDIGHPLASDCWVVRPSKPNQLMPIGFVGELLIGGPKLSRGYLNNPEETARAFINDPPSWLHSFRDPATSPMRLYKTGDLVWYHTDGSLRFVGRKDTQIKLRGQRIEPGEIEAAIHRLLPVGSHVAVDVITRGQGRSTAALAAFIAIPPAVDEEALEPSSAEENLFVMPNPLLQGTLARINQTLARELPKFMVPARYFLLDQMPLTVSEKLDRRLLKQRAQALSEEELRRLTTNTPSTTRRLPANISEELLFRACAKVLGRSADSIGLDDSFFDLGGDSILAISFTQEARKHGLRFKVFDIFRLPKLSDLASNATLYHNVKMSIGSSSYFGFSNEQDLRHAVSGPQVPLDKISKLLAATEAQVAGLHDPLHHLNFHITGPLDSSRLETACQKLVDRHEILRVVFQRVHDQVSQVILRSIDAPVRRLDCRTGSLAECVSSVCSEDDLPLPAFGAPITKFTLVHGPSDEQVLIIRLSPAQYAGNSFPLLTKELKTFYENDELPAPVPFSGLVDHWFRQRSNPDALRFWKTRLQGAKMTLLPEQTSQIDGHGRESEKFVTSEEYARALPIEDVTLATIVKAAWIIVLGSRTRETDLTFGVVCSGRDGKHSDVLGCCRNLLPHRTIVDRDWTVRELLSIVQKWAVESIPFDYLQMADIAEGQEQFGSVLYVQDTKPNHEIDIDGMVCRAEQLAPPPTRPYLTVEVIPHESHLLSLRLTAPENVLTKQRSQAMIGELAKTLKALRSSLGQRLSEFDLSVSEH